MKADNIGRTDGPAGLTPTESRLEQAALGLNPTWVGRSFPTNMDLTAAGDTDGVGAEAEGERDETRQDGVGRRASGRQPLRGPAEDAPVRRRMPTISTSRWPTGHCRPTAACRWPSWGARCGDLLNTPFAELSATPGIGRKKIASFVQLLARAANTDPAELPADILDLQTRRRGKPTSTASRRGRRRFRSGQRLRGDLGAVAGERRPPRSGGRDPRPLRPQPAEHDPRHLEHAAGRLHEFHPGRNPRHEDARREARPRHPRSVSRRPHASWPAWARRNISWCGSFPA